MDYQCSMVGGGSFLKGFTSISNRRIICVSREGELAREQGAMIPGETSVFFVKSRSPCEDGRVFSDGVRHLFRGENRVRIYC